MNGLRRIAPALLLLVLAPLIAEFLLGDFTLRQIGLLLIFVPQYGGGALLIREVARRTGRGWPSILFLALAYALIEEGLTTQSLFNPNYLHLRLLDYGFIPVLGISPNWTVLVLTVHVVWSMGCSIAIAEGVAGNRGSTPWLGRVGLGVTGALFLLGCAMTAGFTHRMYPFVAPPAQLTIVWIAIAASIAAFWHFRSGGAVTTSAPPPAWLIGLVTLILSSGFYELYSRGKEQGLPPNLVLFGMVLCEAAAIVLLTAWSRREGWGPRHVVAAATGAILTYGWMGIARMAAGTTAIGTPTTPVDVAGQVLLLTGVLALAALGQMRQHTP